MNRWKSWTLAALAMVLTGCAQKLTYENWELIQQGESPEAVRAILGKPMEQLPMRWMYMDADRGITADIYFQGENVTGKTWSDPQRGIVGRSPNVNQPGDAEENRFRKIE